MKDAVAVVTGASDGVGRATALALAGRGAALVITGQREDALDDVAAACRRQRTDVLAVPAALADVNAMAAVAHTAAGLFGRVDLWVNCADANSYLHGLRAVLPWMREQRAGVVINVIPALGAAHRSGALASLSPALTGDVQESVADAPGVAVCTVTSRAGMAPEQTAAAVVSCAKRPSRHVPRVIGPLRGDRSHRAPSVAPMSDVRDVGGVPIHARCWIDPGVAGESPPVVLLHGLAVAGRMTAPTAELLARRWHVYAPDLPGFGHSGGNGVLDMDGHADALAAWMRSLSLTRATIVGTSLGCQVGAALAQRHPDLCAALVLASPTVERSRRSWSDQLRRWPREQATQSWPLRTIQATDYLRAGAGRVLKTFRAALHDRIEDRIADVHAPVLVCWGTRDPLLSREWARDLAGAAASGELAVIPGGRHALSHENPLELARLTAYFVDEHRMQ